MDKQQAIEAVKAADIINDECWWDNIEANITPLYARGFVQGRVSGLNESLASNSEDFRKEVLYILESDIWNEPIYVYGTQAGERVNLWKKQLAEMQAKFSQQEPLDFNKHVKWLHELMSRHMHPYNLGDMGETETAIERLIKYTAELREAQQSPSDAVDFVEWIRKSYVQYDPLGRWSEPGEKNADVPVANSTTELYKLFNPSGVVEKTADRFLQGYACAVANICRLNGEADTRTCELFRDGIGKMANLKDAGVDESDLEILKKYFK